MVGELGLVDLTRCGKAADAESGDVGEGELGWVGEAKEPSLAEAAELRLERKEEALFLSCLAYSKDMGLRRNNNKCTADILNNF